MMTQLVGRPLGFDRDAVLDAVVDTFWVHGYTGTTTAVLEAGTGLSRSSLLNTFGPKDALCLAAADRYQERVDRFLLQPLHDGEEGIGGRADVEAFFRRLADLKDSAPGSSGCLIVNLSVESSRRPQGLDVRIARYRQSLQSAFAVALARAEAHGEIRPGDVPARASVLVALAIAVNWAARCGDLQQARQLADSVSSLLSDVAVSAESDPGDGAYEEPKA